MRYILDEGDPDRTNRANIFDEAMKFMGGSMLHNPFNLQGFKSTLTFCSTDVQKGGKPERSQSNPSKSNGPSGLANKTTAANKNKKQNN